MKPANLEDGDAWGPHVHVEVMNQDSKLEVDGLGFGSRLKTVSKSKIRSLQESIYRGLSSGYMRRASLGRAAKSHIHTEARIRSPE